MKVKFQHKKDNVMASLQMELSRMDEITENARKAMVAKHPTGTKVQMLDYMIRECKDTHEIIATTIVWVNMTTKMTEREIFKSMAEKAESEKFANNLKINRD